MSKSDLAAAVISALATTNPVTSALAAAIDSFEKAGMKREIKALLGRVGTLGDSVEEISRALSNVQQTQELLTDVLKLVAEGVQELSTYLSNGLRSPGFSRGPKGDLSVVDASGNVTSLNTT